MHGRWLIKAAILIVRDASYSQQGTGAMWHLECFEGSLPKRKGNWLPHTMCCLWGGFSFVLIATVNYLSFGLVKNGQITVSYRSNRYITPNAGKETGYGFEWPRFIPISGERLRQEYISLAIPNFHVLSQKHNYHLCVQRRNSQWAFDRQMLILNKD